MNKDVANKLTHARTSLVIDHPFLGMLALRLHMTEDVGIKTLAVDGKNIFYNPDFIDSLSLDLTVSAVAHEVFHCVYDHIGRRGGRNPRKYNQAGDYVINATLKDAGMTIGKDWLFNAGFADMSSDEIYNLLPDSDDDDGGDPLDDVRDGNPNETEEMAIQWKIATIEAANTAAQFGKLPASMKRFVEQLTAAKVDWRDILRRFVTQQSADDYSWLRPNRRFVQQGLFLPTLYSETMGEIIVCIDTSGSIGQAMLDAFGAEIKAIVQSTRPSSTHVVYCDADVNHVDTFSPNDELAFNMHGGGGTDFRPPFEYAKEHDIQATCLVYLTDGYGAFPASADFPVLWVMTTDVIAPFGETIRIEV